MRCSFGRWLLLAALTLTLAGCQHLWPNVGRPGTREMQRRRAVVHDPYPDNDAAPEIVGGRPRHYDRPLAEPVRNRVFTDGWWPFH